MTQDTRKDRRVKIVSLNVRYKSATVDEFIDNHALDVSRGGIYIKTNNPFSPGTLLKFEIRLVSDQAVITGVGRVVWKRDAVHGSQDRPPGMGVKFIKVDDPSRALIDKLVNTRADAGKAFESEPEAKPSSGSQKRIPTPGVVHAATRHGSPSSPAVRKGTMVGLGSMARSASPPSGSPGALGAVSPPASVPRPTSTPPLGSPAAASRVPVAQAKREADSPGATIRPAEASGETMRPGEASGETMQPGPDLSSPDVPDLSGATIRPGSLSSPPAYGPSPSASGSSVVTRGPSSPPRPGPTAGNMFPKRTSSSLPPKGEATVMKQAAELLEEALREAGGSMEDVGTNPLFSGASATPEPPVDKSIGRAGENVGSVHDDDHSSTRAEPSAVAKDDDAANNARAMVAAMSPGPIQRRRTDAVAAAREPGDRLGQSSETPSDRSPHAPVAEHDEAEAPGERKTGAALKWLLLLAAALGATALAFRDQIVSAVAGAMGQKSSPSLTSPAPPEAPVAPTVSAAVASASASATPEPSASEVAPAPSAAASSGSSAAPSSVAPPPHGAQPSFAQRPAPAAPPPAYAPPRPKPSPPPAAAPPSPESSGASTAAGPVKQPDTTPPPPAASAPSVSAPAASPAAAASGAGVTSKSHSSGRSADDNPY